MIHLVKGDITQIQVDAIVNAANRSLMGGGGVDGAIHRAGGPQILKECKEYVQKFGKLNFGEAMITGGGNLPAKYVIHTVGPIWKGGYHNEARLLKNAYHNSLNLALDYDLKSIAFPNISTGVYGYPKEEAAGIALSTVKKFLENYPDMEVYFVCYDDDNYKIYQQLMNK